MRFERRGSGRPCGEVVVDGEDVFAVGDGAAGEDAGEVDGPDAGILAAGGGEVAGEIGLGAAGGGGGGEVGAPGVEEGGVWEAGAHGWKRDWRLEIGDWEKKGLVEEEGDVGVDVEDGGGEEGEKDEGDDEPKGDRRFGFGVGFGHGREDSRRRPLRKGFCRLLR